MGIFDLFKGFNKNEKNEHTENRPEIKPYQNSSTITLSKAPVKPSNQRPASQIEENELIKVREMILGCRNPKYDIEIQHRSQDYTTLRYRNLDMARLAWVYPSHHIKISINGKEMEEKYKNSDLFSAQANKNEIMWVSYFSENDITKYYPILLELFDVIECSDFGVVLTPQEEEYIKKGAEVLRKTLGAEGKLYVSRANGYLRLHHELSNVEMELKPYKTKPWRLSCGSKDDEYSLLKSLKLYTGNKKEFSRYLEIDSPDALAQYEPIYKARYDAFCENKYLHAPSPEDLSFYTELPY